MKKKILGLCLIGLWAFNLSAQSPTISFGKPYHKSATDGISQIIGFGNDGFYAQSGKALNKGVVLQKFDRNLNIVDEIILTKRDKEINSFSSIISFTNQKYALYQNRNNRENDRFELYAITLDTKKMVVSSEEKILYSIPIEKENKNKIYIEKGNKNTYEYSKTISQDSSKMALSIELPNKSKKEPNNYMFKVFTNELSPLWEQSHTFYIADRFFQMEAMRVTNDGNIFCLGRVDTKLGVNKKDRLPDSYHIYYISPNQDKPIDIPVKIPVALSDIKMEIAANGDILLAALFPFYSTLNAEAVFLLRIDGVTQEIKQQTLKEIPLDIMKQNTTNEPQNRMKNKDDNSVESFDYNLHDLVLKEDGGLILVGEQFYISDYTTTTYDKNRIPTNSHGSSVYHYNDIRVININPNGDIVWTQKIKKSQTSTNDGGFFSSYTMMTQGDKLHFIFNDDKKNVNYKQGDPQQTLKICRTAVENKTALMVTLDKDGKESREIIMTPKVTRIGFVPKYSTQVSYKDLILYFHQGSTRKLAQLSFD